MCIRDRDSAADNGGVKPGDVIVQVGSKDVIYFKDLQHTVGMTKPNTNLKLRLFRDGKYKNLYVKVGELPSLSQTEPETKEPEVPDYPLGLQLKNLADEDSGEENLGVRVIQVTSNSPAFGEILRGDIILSLIHISEPTRPY